MLIADAASADLWKDESGKGQLRVRMAARRLRAAMVSPIGIDPAQFPKPARESRHVSHFRSTP